MEQSITSVSLIDISGGNKKVLDYSGMLSLYGAEYTPEGYYWQVGETKTKQGWVLHISVIRPKIPNLLNVIIPELMEESLPFSVIRDYQIAGSVMDGSLGYANVGKVINIYPVDDQQALQLAKKLIYLTKDFQGPAIPTDFHLGSVVYTNYEDLDPENNSKVLQIPFKISLGVSWPFDEITIPQSPTPSKLLNYAYYPLRTIKQDAKGDVIQGIYFKSLWKIKFCLIKQGRAHMFADDAGRNIQDRLQWQLDLYHKLADEVPMPVIFDFFWQGKDAYLTMEFIKGTSLSRWITIAYQHRSWKDLPLRAKLMLLDKYIEILIIIDHLHKKGYIHRDITPENFLLGKKEKMFLIDMELAWNSYSMQPDPPFKLGTPGFMSPEQNLCRPPTIKEDIYGLGGLMLVFFTNLSPMKFIGTSLDNLRRQLDFFIGDTMISDLIANCLEHDPFKRPVLENIRLQLSKYRDSLHQVQLSLSSIPPPKPPTKEVIETTIQAGLNGLAFPLLLSPNYRWASRSKRTESHIGNEQIDLGFYNGWHTGMAGPLWLVGLAKNVGFNVEACQTPYTCSWRFIDENFFSDPKSSIPGLYMGGPGIALALVEGLRSGLLQPDMVNLLTQCFVSSLDQPNLAEGWAGEGIALLYCNDWIKHEKLRSLLENCLNNLLTTQLPDGSWVMRAESNKKGDILTGLDYGIAGVIWFLLCYIERYPNKKIEAITCRALDWLIKKATTKKGAYNWMVSTRSKKFDKWSFEHGIPGIFLVLTKAYKVLKNNIYKEIVERYFKEIRPRTVLMDFSLQSGLAGMGELYLEAFQAFGNPAWKERADWIAELFVNTFQEMEPGAGNWLVHPSHMQTSDLFSDNSGILHFLLRHQFPKQISHPLAPAAHTFNDGVNSYLKI